MTALLPTPLASAGLPQPAARPWPKAASLAVLAAILLGGGMMIATDIGVIEEGNQAIAARETRRDSLLRAADRLKAGAAVADGTTNASPYLAGESETIAAAGLQTLVIGAVEARSGKVASALVRLPPNGPSESGPGGGTARPVDVEVVFEAGVAGLQHILFDLETGTPEILVNRLQIQPKRADGAMAGTMEQDDPTLRVILAVRAYWQR